MKRRWLLIGLFLGAGCAGRASLLPNADPSLRKSSAQFAADAAKRHYPTDTPRGGQAIGRAQVGYVLKVVEIINLSDQDWNDVDVWVNHKYVVHIPKLPKYSEGSRVTQFNFQMLFDNEGQSFPTDNSKVLVDTVEVFRDGKLYDVTVKQAD